MIKAIAVATLMLVALPALAENTLAVEEVAPGHFELTMISNSVFDVRSAQALLVPTAESLCPNKHPEFGRYRFENTESASQLPGPGNPNNFKIVQQIECVDAVRAPEVSDRRSFISDPNDQRIVREHILSLSESYFANIFRGNYEKAFASLSADMRSYQSFDEWSMRMDQIRAE